MATHHRKQERLSRFEEEVEDENRRHRAALVNLRERYDALVLEEKERHDRALREIRESSGS